MCIISETSGAVLVRGGSDAFNATLMSEMTTEVCM